MTLSERSGGMMLSALRIWAAAWITFLISIVPLYVFRGNYHDVLTRDQYERVLMTFIGLVFGTAICLLLTARNERTARLTRKEGLIEAGGAVGVYCFAWLLLLIGGNNYLIAVCGHYLQQLLGLAADGNPTFGASFLAMLIYGACYFGATALGTYLARKRHLKL